MKLILPNHVKIVEDPTSKHYNDFPIQDFKHEILIKLKQMEKQSKFENCLNSYFEIEEFILDY